MAAGGPMYEGYIARRCLGQRVTYSADGTFIFTSADGAEVSVILRGPVHKDASGAYGAVYSTSDPTMVAKLIRSRDSAALDRRVARDLKNETRILQYRGQFRGWSALEAGRLSRRYVLAIFMLRIPGHELYRDIERHAFATATACIQMARHLLDAVIEMHDARVYGRPKLLHRDLKPENVIVSPDGRYRLVDWGHATFMPLDETAPYLTAPCRAGRGTVRYTPTSEVEELCTTPDDSDPRYMKLDPVYLGVYRRVDRVLAAEGGIDAFRVVTRDPDGGEWDSIDWCTSTELYAIAAIMECTLRSMRDRRALRNATPVLDFMARACSMRDPIPLPWVRAALLSLGDRHDSPYFAPFSAASLRLSSLARQRSTVHVDARPRLELRIAQWYADPLGSLERAAREHSLAASGAITPAGRARVAMVVGAGGDAAADAGRRPARVGVADRLYDSDDGDPDGGLVVRRGDSILHPPEGDGCCTIT